MIEQLNIAHDSELSDLAIESISMNLPHLYSLKLDNIIKLTDSSISILSLYTRERLQVLSLAGIRSLTSSSLLYISKYCKGITNLNLSSTRFSADSICSLLGSLVNLKVLNLSTQPNINNQVVLSASKINFLQDLVCNILLCVIFTKIFVAGSF